MSRELKKTTDFSQAGKVPILVYEYFLSNGSSDEIQGSEVVFNIKLENDDIQDIDLRWEQTPLFRSDPLSNNVFGGIYVTKLQHSSQIQTIMALYNQEILRGGGKRNYH